MNAFSASSRFFLYQGVCDMRKGFDGLCGLVRTQMKQDPLSGDVFVFINRRRTHIKLLVWDRTGNLDVDTNITSPKTRRPARSTLS